MLKQSSQFAGNFKLFHQHCSSARRSTGLFIVGEARATRMERRLVKHSSVDDWSMTAWDNSMDLHDCIAEKLLLCETNTARSVFVNSRLRWTERTVSAPGVLHGLILKFSFIFAEQFLHCGQHDFYKFLQGFTAVITNMVIMWII